MTEKHVTDISAALSAVRDAMDTGSLTLDQILEKAPEVALTVRVPAVYALLVETYATRHGISRHECAKRIMLDGINRVAQGQALPEFNQSPEAA